MTPRSKLRRIAPLLVVLMLASGGFYYWKGRPGTSTEKKQALPLNALGGRPYANLEEDPDDLDATEDLYPADTLRRSQAAPRGYNARPHSPSETDTASDYPKGLSPGPAIPTPHDSEAFTTLAEKLLTDLSGISDQNPEGLMNAAARLESIAEAVTQHPQLKEDGISFYKRCSENSESPPPVRALCLSNLQELSPQAGAQTAATIDPAISAMVEEDDE